MITRFGDHELDTETYELRLNGERVAVEPQVFDVLAHLIRHRDRVVTKDELLDQVWGDRFVSESALTSRIKDARRAIGDDGRRQDAIRTMHGRGYRFVAQAEEDAGTPAAPPVDIARPASDPAPTTRYTRSGGYDIAYQVLGDAEGDDILFIPGFVSNLDLHWEFEPMIRFFNRLASFGRLIMFDKRGTGVSERVPTDRLPTLEERMDDVRCVLDAVGCERATLFGISEGGPMSLLFAATHPERVERLILYGTFAREPFVDPQAFADDTKRLWGRGLIFSMLAPSWVEGEPSDGPVSRFLARFERQSASPDGASALVSMISETDAFATLASITVPTLVLHRTDDEVIPFDRAEELAAGIPSARLVGLGGRDHFAPVESDDLLDEVERFLDSVAPAGAPSESVLTTLLCVTPGAGEWFEHEVAGAGGSVVSATGVDDRWATFGGPAKAVRAALAIAARHGDNGCAVHTAEIERRAAQIAGVGVDVTAALAERVPAGDVVVTRTVRDLVAGSGLVFEPRGEHLLGALPDAWPVYAAIA